MTILDYFLKWERETPQNIFLAEPKGKAWKYYTWAEAGAEARNILASLQGLGYSQGDRIALLSANCAQWIFCDLALMMGGFISVPLYANISATSLRSILSDSGAKLIFIGKLSDSDWRSQKEVNLSTIRAIAMNGYARSNLLPWESFIEKRIDVRPAVPNANDVCTIIYTSGTTGDPKGVVHTFGSIFKAVDKASVEVVLNRKDNRFLSYLPLSHAAERGIVEFGCMYCGGSIYFVESLESFRANIRDVQPTHFFGVPRIWEKFQSGVYQKFSPSVLNFLLRVPVVKNVIISVIKKSLGLNKSDVIISGAAPLAPELAAWFENIGIRIREGYGLSENFNVISINPSKEIRIGTVGKVFDNQKVKIIPNTQEIIQKCDWLMQGYYNKPELTAATIIDGYLHTGDMGFLSQDGYLTITGRVKDIFKTTKGEYISPYLMELPLMDSNLVDQACVMGSVYPQPFALIVLSDIGKKQKKEDLKDHLTSILESINKNLMQYQKLKKVIISNDQWTTQNGMLTPTLKLKRNLLSQKYEPLLKDIYAINEPVTWFNHKDS